MTDVKHKHGKVVRYTSGVGSRNFLQPSEGHSMSTGDSWNTHTHTHTRKHDAHPAGSSSIPKLIEFVAKIPCLSSVPRYSWSEQFAGDAAYPSVKTPGLCHSSDLLSSIDFRLSEPMALGFADTSALSRRTDHHATDTHGGDCNSLGKHDRVRLRHQRTTANYKRIKSGEALSCIRPNQQRHDPVLRVGQGFPRFVDHHQDRPFLHQLVSKSVWPHPMVIPEVPVLLTFTLVSMLS